MSVRMDDQNVWTSSGRVQGPTSTPKSHVKILEETLEFDIPFTYSIFSEYEHSVVELNTAYFLVIANFFD